MRQKSRRALQNARSTQIIRRVSQLINDPIYGFIELPKQGAIAELLHHPYFQRLRRISQLGMAQYVYPNASHSRFSHTLGALHLMQNALSALQRKGADISEQEVEATQIAILLHDLGHCPFSHSLEFQLLNIHHERLSQAMMEQLNAQDGSLQGALSLALSIFKDEYHKPFLHQLVSSQIDMDRLDYLTRDSYFTGVMEGKVGYKRILQTLQIVDNQLVIAYKGIYSIEHFLIARRLMYWQVYLHKAVVCASAMLSHVVARARELLAQQPHLWQGGELSPALRYFLAQQHTEADLQTRQDEILGHFALLDDGDLWQALKSFAQDEDPILSLLARQLLHRQLFKVEASDTPFSSEEVEQMRHECSRQMGIPLDMTHYLVFTTQQANRAYNSRKQSIRILRHDGTVRPISDWAEHHIQRKEVIKHYLCYARRLERAAK